MQVSGRLLVLVTFAISVAMAGGAWWYNYQQSRRAAEFWGAEGGLLVASEKLTLVELGEPTDARRAIAGRAVVRETELAHKPGLVHLRHALAYDANFQWSERRSEPLAQSSWAYALRFAADERQLLILFSRDFTRLGNVEPEGVVQVLPCPALGPVVLEYLGKIGVELPKPEAR